MSDASHGKFTLHARNPADPSVVVIGAGLAGGVFASTLRSGASVLDAGPWVGRSHAQTLGWGPDHLADRSCSDWTTTSTTSVPGVVRAVGGGSLFWSAWSPDPLPSDVRTWPALARRRLREGLPAARKLLGVRGVPGRGGLGREICQRTATAVRSGRVRHVEPGFLSIMAAPVAMTTRGDATCAAALLEDSVVEGRCEVRPDSPVDRLVIDNDAVVGVVLVDSGDVLPVDPATPVVLAANTIETTRILLASRVISPHLGHHLSGHTQTELNIAWRSAPCTQPQLAVLLLRLAIGASVFTIQLHAARGPWGRRALLSAVPGIFGPELLAASAVDTTVLSLVGVTELPDCGSVRLSEAVEYQDGAGARAWLLFNAPDPATEARVGLIDDVLDDLGEALSANGTDIRYRGAIPSPWRAKPPPRVTAPGGRHWGACVHASGTTRMADRAGDGVVDPTGRVFDVVNLFVLGMGTFPSPGIHNGGLAIAAQAVRLASDPPFAAGRQHVSPTISSRRPRAGSRTTTT